MAQRPSLRVDYKKEGMATQSSEPEVTETETTAAKSGRAIKPTKNTTPRPPLGQVFRSLQWRSLLLFGIGCGILWVLFLLQGGTLAFFAGLLPVTGGIILGRRIRQHTNWHAAMLSLVTAITALITTVVALSSGMQIDPLVRQTLLTSFTLLLPFPAFGVITAARSEQRAREVRETQSKRGGRLDRPGRVKSIEDLQALSINQLGGFVADLFRRHGFMVDDFQFKENVIDFNFQKDDEPWLVRVMVEEKVKQGVALQFHQHMRSLNLTKGVLITSMDFQDQATRWAKDKNHLVLIDGATLISMND